MFAHDAYIINDEKVSVWLQRFDEIPKRLGYINLDI